jgi:Mce-associated membrane protein
MSIREKIARRSGTDLETDTGIDDETDLEADDESAADATGIGDEPDTGGTAVDEADDDDDDDGTEADAEFLDAEEDYEEDEDGGEEAYRRRRWRGAIAIALVFTLAGGVFQVLAWRAGHTRPTENQALTDTDTTSVVIGDVSNGLNKIFSYAPDSTATTEQAAADVLGGTAANEYRTLFAQVKAHAAAEHLTLSTRVVRAGVTHLSGGTAQLLVFLDQRAVRAGRPQGTTSAAQLSVTARLEDGHWRIVDIHAR